MSILLTKVNILNYRSIESLSLDLGVSNLLIGQNNSGKTNFLRAINIALSGSADVSGDDIYVAQGENLDKNKTAIIDIMLQPVDKDNQIEGSFNEFWTSVFTTDWINTSSEGDFVGIRTIIEYDEVRDAYSIKRQRILQWAENGIAATVENRRVAFNEDMRIYMQTHYLDANRDIVEDLRNRRSYFARVTSSYDISDDTRREIEQQLSAVNNTIVNSIPTLRQTKERISAIGEIIGEPSSNVEIEPLARKLSDLNRGMDIIIQSGSAASFPISQHGSGTRSWISFLTLAAFVENQKETLIKSENAELFFVLSMEEPEAHLHPQAQRQLFEQIYSFSGQKIVSTHSPYVVAQSDLKNIIYFSMRNGITIAIRYESNNLDEQKIYRDIINTPWASAKTK